MSPDAILILKFSGTIGGILCATIVALYIDIRKKDKRQDANLTRMIEAMLGNKSAIELNTKATETNISINEEIKTMLHTINTDLAIIKASGK